MSGDPWATWVLCGRDGSDADVLTRRLPAVHECRDRILDQARLAPGHAVLDVGTGSGLLALAALDRVGPAGRVVFCDISEELLAACARLAAPDSSRCSFLRAAADHLSAIPDGTLDAVVNRSVLMYVARKDRAFREYHRVLRPGGRMSIYEPVNSFAYPEPPHLLLGVNVAPVVKLAARVKLKFSPPGAGDHFPMLDFDHHDLLRHAEQAGFTELELHYEARLNVREPLLTDDWDVFRKMSPNPLAPSLGEAVEQALSPDEQDRFVAHMREQLAANPTGIFSSAAAYLSGVRH